MKKKQVERWKKMHKRMTNIMFVILIQLPKNDFLLSEDKNESSFRK